jgi:hypothetical protein
MILFVALSERGSEKKPVPGSEKSVAGSPVTGPEKKPVNEKTQAWEAAEIGDVVSLKYPGTNILCEGREEASQPAFRRS